MMSPNAHLLFTTSDFSDLTPRFARANAARTAANGSSRATGSGQTMKEIIIQIVQSLPATLAAFGAIVRWGDDDEERLATLENVVADLREKMENIHGLIEAKKHERHS